MKSKNKSKNIGLVVLTVILAISVFWVATVGAQQEPTPTPTLTPTENETLECKTLWYFDDQSVQCQQKQFCGLYMYKGLRTFETEEECKVAFEKYLKEKGEETLKCKTLWYFDDQSVQCQQKQFCGLYMYKGLHTFETEEECKVAFETYLKEKGEVTSTPAPPGFEVGFAIAGLLAVAYLVLRRRK